MADGTPGSQSRRIWTRCPFCKDVTDMPSNHLDSYNKGCRGALEESGMRKKTVMEKMRDEAYDFTFHQSVNPSVLERILRRRAAGPEARACMLDLLGELNVKLKPSHPPAMNISSDDDTSQNLNDASDAQGASIGSKASSLEEDSGIRARLSSLEVRSPDTTEKSKEDGAHPRGRRTPSSKGEPSTGRTPVSKEFKGRPLRNPDSDKVGLSYATVAKNIVWPSKMTGFHVTF